MKTNKAEENNQDNTIGYRKGYHTNGNLWYEGNSINGTPVGLWQFYNSNGNLMYKGKYINGKTNGIRTGLWQFYNTEKTYKQLYYT